MLRRLEEGLAFSSHSAVIAGFGKTFARTGRLDARFHRYLIDAQDLRTLHLGYETVAPYPLTREERLISFASPEVGGALLARKPRLAARKQAGVIEIDIETTLRGVPPEAWEYQLGTYTALEWVLERHKERTPKDPTVRQRFNTYRFADHKERMIDLLGRVCAVSVETMRIVQEMGD